MWDESVSQQPPKIVAPLLIIFSANLRKTSPVISTLFPSVIFGFFPISLYPAVLNLCTGKGSSTAHKFALKPNGISKLFNSSEIFSIISKETHAATTPSHLAFLYFFTTFVIVSLLLVILGIYLVKTSNKIKVTSV